ncbi:N-6 DNA methylase [Streptococcus suis]|uniref:Eco57I restriction-modification methylase domain-containing protein n=1 Tax=Streptococcus suis TaxID=1307 RepID=UPI0037CE05A0
MDRDYESLVTFIEQLILKKLNIKHKYSWRELVATKNHYIYEMIKDLIFYIKDKLGYCEGVRFPIRMTSFELFDQVFCDFKKLTPNNIDIARVYQMLLAGEIRLVNEKYEYYKDKHHRDNLGSYYTPQELSDVLVQEVLEQYLLQNYSLSLFDKSKKERIIEILSKTSVADLSVGGAAFLVSYFRIIKDRLTTDRDVLKKISKCVVGIDVDPVALLLSEYNISNEIGSKSDTELILGNPLFTSNESKSVKECLSFEGRMYSKDIGINLDSIVNSRGFDIIIGNPPWEKLRFEERKFFRSQYETIANQSSKTHRQKEIESLKETNASDYKYYFDMKNDYADIKERLKSNPYLDLSISGELNTYNLFYELAFKLLNKRGVVGLLVKSSMVKVPSNRKLFNYLLENEALISIDIFKNSQKIFPIDSREEFAFAISTPYKNKRFRLRSNLTGVSDFSNNDNGIVISRDDIEIINPTTKMIPNFRTKEETEFVVQLYRKFRRFDEVFPDVRFGRLVHLTNHSEFIYKESSKGIPIYEGKFIERYDGRYSTFKGVKEIDRYKNKTVAVKQTRIKEIPQSRYFIDPIFWEKISQNYKDDYTVMWRSLTSVSNRRTMVATILPFIPTSQSIQFLQISESRKLIFILSIFNSIIFDYIIRMKMPGIDLTQSVIRDIPFPEFDSAINEIEFHGKTATIFAHIESRIKWLYREDYRLNFLFSCDVYTYTSDSEKKCNAELDVLVAKLYGLRLEEIRKVASYFPAYYTLEDVQNLFY